MTNMTMDRNLEVMSNKFKLYLNNKFFPKIKQYKIKKTTVIILTDFRTITQSNEQQALISAWNSLFLYKIITLYYNLYYKIIFIKLYSKMCPS